jgi:U3 small nucleolar RNA-associated protein 23
MVLEPPSDTTLDAKRAHEEQTLRATLPELKLVASTSTSIQPTRKKKGPKGPNPLSVKKKKPKERSQPGKALASGGKISAGLKRKSDQAVDHDAEVRMHGDGSPIERKQKRRKKSDSDSHCFVDAINEIQ